MQVIQLVVTPLCIVLNNPRLCTVILRRIVHLFVVEGGGREEGREGEKWRREEGGKGRGRGRREERKEGESKIEGEEEGGDREEAGRYAAVLNRDVHTTRVVNLNRQCNITTTR